MLPTLCKTCQEIFTGRCSHDDDTNHHLHLYQLQQSASEECFVCIVLWRGVDSALPLPVQAPAECPTHTDLETGPEKPVSRYRLSHKSSRSSANPYNISELAFTVQRDGIVNGGRRFVFCLQPLATSNLDRPEQFADIASLDASFDTARTWLQNCLQSHVKCRETLKLDRVNPTRLLQIAQDGSNTIRLTVDISKDPVFQYATVSHCWGTSLVWRLTAETLHQLRHGLAIAELGQTFQDVIHATKSLGLQYVWIDSLCIFQDSRADWEHEAPLMSEIYKNAVVNIAASAASNNQSGCLSAGDRVRASPCYVKSAWTDCGNNDSFHIYYDHFWWVAFENMPLITRAWVVQELLLAPRVLHLADKQFYWQCYDLAACESYPGGLPPSLWPEEVPRDALYQVIHQVGSDLKDRPNPNSASLKGLQELWNGILSMYTHCNLTNASDKLVALAGVAKVMQKAFNDKYYAGMWKTDMVTQLSWTLSREQPLFPSTPRSRPYRAPSWSWACLDGHVAMAWLHDDYEDKIDLIDVLECQTTNVLGDRTSTVTSGYIKLSGWLSTIQLDRDKETKGYAIYINKSWLGRVPQDLLSLDCQLPSMRLHCLPLFVDIHQMPLWNMPLLLLHQTGDVRGQFRRYGLMQLFAGGLNVENWTDFKSFKNDPWLEYESIDSDGKHTLTII